MPSLLFDLVLAGTGVWVGWRALSAGDLFVSVVLYIVFGLLMSLVWARLGAADIALAEAAIGAGLTGALLLDAAAEFQADDGGSATAGRRRPRRDRAAALVTLAIGVVLAWTVVGLPARGVGLTREVLGSLDRSVAQPVTAVLLDLRGYDTLLEMGVLLVAALGMLALLGGRDLDGAAGETFRDPLLRWMVGLLLPLLVLTGAHLLFLGTRGPGGAFQAGSVLAAGGVLLLVAGYRSIMAAPGLLLRSLLLLGFGALLFAAIGTLLAGRRMLEYPPGEAPALILALEAAIMISVAATLSALFAGGRATDHDRRAPDG